MTAWPALVRTEERSHDKQLRADCPISRKNMPIVRWDQATRSRVETPVTEVDASAQSKVSCWWCRSQRGKLRSKHRRRPMLPIVKGACQLCEGELTGRRRAWCSDECGTVWMAAATPHLMLVHLVEIHGWYCWDCGELSDSLDVDHIKPLWSLTDEERTQPRWWLPYNVQLLCVDCHKRKTAREAAARAAARRVA